MRGRLLSSLDRISCRLALKHKARVNSNPLCPVEENPGEMSLGSEQSMWNHLKIYSCTYVETENQVLLSKTSKVAKLLLISRNRNEVDLICPVGLKDFPQWNNKFIFFSFQSLIKVSSYFLFLLIFFFPECKLLHFTTCPVPRVPKLSKLLLISFAFCKMLCLRG